MKAKKGSVTLNVALGIIMFIAIAGILAVMTHQVNEDSRTSFATSSGSVTNETLTTVAETGEYINSTVRSQCSFTSFAVSAIVNSSNGAAIPSTNYTYTSAGKVSVKAGTVSVFNNTDWKVTYSYKYASGNNLGCNSTIESDKGIYNVTKNFDLIGLATAFGLVIAIIFAAINFKRDGF